MFFANSILLGVGLAMDAFSVSVANGLNEPRMHLCLFSMVHADGWLDLCAHDRAVFSCV